MTNRPDDNLVWWGNFSLAQGESGLWRIGPASFRIERLKCEWRILYDCSGDPQDNNAEVLVPLAQVTQPGPASSLTRFGAGGTVESLQISPALADRPVVIRPEVPFFVLPNEEVNFYAGTPLWFRVEVGKRRTLLQDAPIIRPSDTWFGPSTMEGELCYANRLFGKLEISELSFRPHRATTVILLRNKGRKSIRLERFNLPVPNLSLYQSAESRLWTQQVTLDLGDDEHTASLGFKPVAPAAAGKAKIVCEPRLKPDQNILTRAMNYLIS
ncbi:MAG: hypothetical protein A2Z86_11240 [Candidatus Glassbacteria bacterium GWA2_58_10]|uniref:DUF432 domain-containing protein n=1 Tax=Candidatus Glassbacteria bacterium GWA2_58_10 TaxID=1817865 RepID=A0A1F5YHY6_9BACT|nr:MAG: hypothetical protein A2Z86_11240 [Candidatus Glassbacteria bacterium GWA2_58_10]